MRPTENTEGHYDSPPLFHRDNFIHYGLLDYTGGLWGYTVLPPITQL